MNVWQAMEDVIINALIHKEAISVTVLEDTHLLDSTHVKVVN